MKRIMLLLTVVALMTVMLAMSASAAFAQGGPHIGKFVSGCVTQEQCRAFFVEFLSGGPN